MFFITITQEIIFFSLSSSLVKLCLQEINKRICQSNLNYAHHLVLREIRELFKKAHSVEIQRIFTSADETGLLCNDENTRKNLYPLIHGSNPFFVKTKLYEVSMRQMPSNKYNNVTFLMWGSRIETSRFKLCCACPLMMSLNVLIGLGSGLRFWLRSILNL